MKLRLDQQVRVDPARYVLSGSLLSVPSLSLLHSFCRRSSDREMSNSHSFDTHGMSSRSKGIYTTLLVTQCATHLLPYSSRQIRLISSE